MFKILLQISLRNLFAHKTTSIIVGSIIGFGTFLAVLGTAMLDSVDRSMGQSITESIAGHIQVYSKDAKDELALFGGGFMGGTDIGEIDDFATVRRTLEALPNVKAVVPMGLATTLVNRGNEVDKTVADLRDAVTNKDIKGQRALAAKLRSIASGLIPELENVLTIAKDRQKVEDNLQDLRHIDSDEFWEGLSSTPETTTAFIDTKLAPLAENGRFYYLHNLGTDIDRFVKLFSRFEMLEGDVVPTGQRGLLFSKRFYEQRIKHPIAADFDKLHREKMIQHHRLDDTKELQDRARRLPRQYRRITHQLSVADTHIVANKLRALLDGPKDQAPDQSIETLIQRFLTLDDDNFELRYAQFYEIIAPKIQLYALPVGSEVTLRAVTKSGYPKSLKVKVWGVYRFTSLEDSDLAGAQNLIDMQSFRELYGVMTREKQAELEAIRREVGIEDLERNNAEDALFGGDSAAPSDTSNVADVTMNFDDAELTFAKAPPVAAGAKQAFHANIDEGLALNAAVILHDPSKLKETQAAIEALAQELGLKVIDWQTASGMVGQFISLLRIVLYIAIVIIFIVALVIINNAMVMATLERTSEIGTIRAIGARRRFVVSMLLVETATLSFIAGTLGALLGAGCITYLGTVGIPAPSDVLVFLFSGPRLYPSFGLAHLVLAFVVVLFVSLASTLYPARIASGIQPVVAMQEKD